MKIIQKDLFWSENLRKSETNLFFQSKIIFCSLKKIKSEISSYLSGIGGRGGAGRPPSPKPPTPRVAKIQTTARSWGYEKDFFLFIDFW
jgi:hypothetical protein